MNVCSSSCLFCWYLAGKISYTKTCQEKLKRLENSPIAEALRMRTGQYPSSFQRSQSEPSSSDSQSGELVFQPTESQSQTPDLSRDYGYGYNDESPMQIERPDDFSGPASYPPYVEEEVPKKKTILYEDLRQKNRENYEGDP
ncbi:OCIA domain-containing protein 1-like [Thalassophryne amazonica]|uniref:OCIA domain-containing protein 1-like n=1 Tax=Thalassophryne amazonica TaxID=390379 RepID=UPI001471E7A1|nr:OCIA domain-containing protein 1-like [Thalassophryne amazonica]